MFLKSVVSCEYTVSTTRKIKAMETMQNSDSTIKKNTEVLEKIFVMQEIDLSWLNHSLYEYNAIVDVAIATLAQHNNKMTMQEILDEEDLNSESLYESSLIRVMTEIYAFWVDKKAIITRTDNMIDAPDEVSWKPLFNHAVVNLILAEGRLVSFNANYYGWSDYYSELKNEDVVAVFNLKEDEWDEFEGTFVTQQDSHTGFKCEVMFKDGTFRELRLEGDMGSIMRKIT